MKEECLICKAPLEYLTREDWGLEDPSGKCDDAFLETIRLIEEKVLDLKARLK